MKKKFTYITFIALAALFIVIASYAQQSFAFANTCNNKKHRNNITHSACSYNVTVSGSTYAVNLDIYHCTSHYSSATACAVGIQISTAHLSPSTLSGNWDQYCGNSWGTYSSSIIAGPPSSPGNPGSGGGPNFGTNGSASTTGTTTLTRECTPGINCPDTDLGKIITQAELNPAYASSRTNTCPFFYTVGNEDADRKISCALISNGKTTILPKLEPDHTNGYALSIGISTFTCSRSDGMSTTTESKTLTCNGNPSTIEH